MAPSTRSTSKPVILVAHDHPLDETILKQVLSEEGFEVVEVKSAEACLNAVNKSLPVLILLDLILPGNDSHQTLRKLRETYSSIELPIIVITAKTDALDVIESFRLGANDCIIKPAHLDVAAMRVRTQLNLAKLSREMAHLQKIEAIHAMVTTYHHEINNPLTIALLLVEKLLRSRDCAADVGKIEIALKRIEGIVKKIKETTENSAIEYDQYSKKSKMVKIR